MTWTRKALISAIASLHCGPINAIYIDAIHDSFCTDGAEGLAWAFILFSVVSVGAMVMVGLRASLYNQHVGEDEVYDDSEVADNMILNEHEEYLAYISKYKHEWEEYRGINAEPLDQSQQSGGDSVESIVASESWTERGDDEVAIESWDLESEGHQTTGTDSEHDYGSIESCPTDDISFPSLHGSQRNGNSPPVPSILGAPPGETDEAWDKEPDFFLGHKNCQVTVPPAATNESEEPNIEVHLSPTADRDDIYTPTHLADIVQRDGPPVDEEDFHKSLYYVQSPESQYTTEFDWDHLFFVRAKTNAANRAVAAAAASDSGVNVALPEAYNSPAHSKQGILGGFAKKIASPDVLDHLNYFGRHELPSPKITGNIQKASPKLKLVVQKYEI